METSPIHVDVYDDNPAGYDQFQSYFLGQSERARAMFAAMFEALELTPGQRVLEVGMGTGLNLPFFPDDVELHGIDRSEAMLAQARERLEQSGRTADVRVGDAYELPYADEHFDRIACIFVSCTLDTPDRALAQMHRVCRSGGLVALFDYHLSENPRTRFDQQFMNETMRRGVLFQGKPVIACDSMYALEPQLEGLSFEIVLDERMDEGLASSFRATVLRRR